MPEYTVTAVITTDNVLHVAAVIPGAHDSLLDDAGHTARCVVVDARSPSDAAWMLQAGHEHGGIAADVPAADLREGDVIVEDRDDIATITGVGVPDATNVLAWFGEDPIPVRFAKSDPVMVVRRDH